jgi:hypothetical protein
VGLKSHAEQCRPERAARLLCAFHRNKVYPRGAWRPWRGGRSAICIASSTSPKEEQMKDPRKLWGLSNTCLREQARGIARSRKQVAFNTTTLIPKNSS